MRNITMPLFSKLFLLLIYVLALSACSIPISDKGSFAPGRKVYSPDSSRFLLLYHYEQGAWDGGRSYFVTVLNRADSIIPENISFSYSSLDFQNIYWKNNDTVIIEPNYTDYMADKTSAIHDTLINGVAIKALLRDPIDTTFTQKIFFRETSPDQRQELVVYRYIKPGGKPPLLQISIINKGDTIPKYGNFYISRYNFDCFNDIRWNSSGVLDCKVSSSCYYAFADYLVKKQPDVKLKVTMDDNQNGNIRQ